METRWRIHNSASGVRTVRWRIWFDGKLIAEGKKDLQVLLASIDSRLIQEGEDKEKISLSRHATLRYITQDGGANTQNSYGERILLKNMFPTTGNILRMILDWGKKAECSLCNTALESAQHLLGLHLHPRYLEKSKTGNGNKGKAGVAYLGLDPMEDKEN